ncbi:MAG: hypothetical protein J3K34DRAFT_405109 [Monoraphidium minutum]|nr:MAG: hypothetical protein J3K34DRAFT_405109 [Monoraphidium minutum]
MRLSLAGAARRGARAPAGFARARRCMRGRLFRGNLAHHPSSNPTLFTQRPAVWQPPRPGARGPCPAHPLTMAQACAALHPPPTTGAPTHPPTRLNPASAAHLPPPRTDSGSALDHRKTAAQGASHPLGPLQRSPPCTLPSMGLASSLGGCHRGAAHNPTID